MNKYLSVVAAILFMTACSNDDEVKGGATDKNDPNAPTLTLTVMNSGNLSTRASRPVNSSQATSIVNKVQLAVYPEGSTTPLTLTDGGLITWTTANGVTDLISNDGVPGTEEHGTQLTYTFAKGQLAANKKYYVIAYGYNDTSFGYTLSAFNTNSMDYQGTLVSGAPVEEVFAAKSAFTTTAMGTFNNAVLTMTRQVAGTLGYFNNIPVQSYEAGNVNNPLHKVRYIKLIASQANTVLTFPVNGEKNTNGSTPANDKEIFSIDLSTLATNYAATTTGVYTIPAMNTANLKTVENSALAGSFMIPTAFKLLTPTLKLVLYSDDATPVELKSWTVNIPAVVADINFNDPLTNLPVTITGDVSTSIYSIRRNVFYSIGQKQQADTTDPDPADPNDNDTPIDLTNSSQGSITLQINDAWETINNMGLN